MSSTMLASVYGRLFDLRPCKIQPVPAFLFVSGAVDNARLWDINDSQ
jgi:hypothetical protein